MDRSDDVGPRQRQQIIVTPQVAPVVNEAITAIARLVEAVPLDHGAHGTVDNQDALRCKFMQTSLTLGTRLHIDRRDGIRHCRSMSRTGIQRTRHCVRQVRGTATHAATAAGCGRMPSA